jgi:hypothetical protein
MPLISQSVGSLKAYPAWSNVCEPTQVKKPWISPGLTHNHVSTKITAPKSFIRLAPGRRDETGAAEKIGGRIWTDYPRSGGTARQAGGAAVVLDG